MKSPASVYSVWADPLGCSLGWPASGRAERAFGRIVRPGEAGRRKSEQYQGRKSVRSNAGPAGPADETPHTHTQFIEEATLKVAKRQH